MAKKILLLILLISTLSCSVSKHKSDVDLESFKDFKKVKIAKLFSISEYKKLPDTSKIDFHFDRKGKLIKQIDYYKNGNIITHFSYNKIGFISEEFSINDDSTSNSKNIYEYDSNGNLVKYKSFSEGKLMFEKLMFYDKKNNLTETKYINHPSGKISIEKYFQNYDENFEEIITVDSVRNEKSTLFRFYDKKGNLIRTNFSSKVYNSTSKMEYDKNGNITKMQVFRDEELTLIKKYEYTFDERKNIIERNLYENDEKLVRKEIFLLVYY